MRIRKRLVWSFAAMLAVPLFLFMAAGGAVRALTDPSRRSERRGGFLNIEQGVSVFNGIIADNPDSLFETGTLDTLLESLPKGLALGVYRGDALVRTTQGFNDGWSAHRNRNSSILKWKFALSDGSPALFEIRWQPEAWMADWGLWLFLGTLGAAFILVLTNGILSFMVSRSILGPLALLEEAARKVGEGDLDEFPLPGEGDEFGDVGRVFDEMRRRLKESLERQNTLEEDRRTWVASVSHDIRTPLAVLKGYAEGLRDGVANTPEKQNRYISVLLDRAALMEKLIEDLFHWARWDWGDPALKFEPLELNAEIGKAVASWRIDWPTLTVVWHPGPPTVLSIDPWSFLRILDNLARNVVHHAGVNPALEVSLESGQSGIRVLFRDNGPGIAPEVLPHVFERFYRGDPARQTNRGGGGLGLTIAQSLSRAMGADLSVESEVGKGALFILEWPTGGKA